MEDERTKTSHVTTDHETIRNWAEKRGAKPASVTSTSEGDDPGILRLDFPEEEADENLSEISWDQFFRKFDEKELAFVYQDTKASGEESWFGKLVYRDSTAAREAMDADEGETATAVDQDQMGAAAETDTPSETEVAEAMDEDAASPEMGEAEMSRSTTDETIEEALAVDEIHENALGPDDWNKNDEYLVFRNDGDEPLDLSNWTVTSEEGHTYRFPENYTLDPDERVTLFTGDGEDTDVELYWKSDEAVWKNEGDTVTVKDPDGRPVLEQSYD